MLTDLTHAVHFLQTAYTILLSLAFGEAFKQLVPDGDQIIRWDRLGSLLAFLFMIFPFFHGMSRYFYMTYLHSNGDLASVAFYLMIDGICFMTMAALFEVVVPGALRRQILRQCLISSNSRPSRIGSEHATIAGTFTPKRWLLDRRSSKLVN